MTMPRFDYVGGRPVLDFCNTVDFWEAMGGRFIAHDDLLLSIGDVNEWVRGAALEVAPGARGEVEPFLELRGILLALFHATASGARVGEPLKVFNRALSRVPARVIQQQGREFHWTWQNVSPGDQIQGALLLDAAALLTDPILSRLRCCEAENCGWLFLDQSRNHMRRWCDMKDCGNRSKARRFYQRSRAE
jgi:predicted RNA-binding Zn ribbon-like protein